MSKYKFNDINNYSSINYVCPASEFYARILSSPNNNTYSFSLTDENGELINLYGLNLNMTFLLFKKDPIFDQIRNFLKLLVMIIISYLSIYIKMASESAIAEGPSVVTSDQINYHQKMFSHPSNTYLGQPVVSETS